MSIRTLLSLFVLSAIAIGCSQAEPKKVPVQTPEQKTAADKAHDDAKKSNAGSTTPAK